MHFGNGRHRNSTEYWTLAGRDHGGIAEVWLAQQASHDLWQSQQGADGRQGAQSQTTESTALADDENHYSLAMRESTNRTFTSATNRSPDINRPKASVLRPLFSARSRSTCSHSPDSAALR
jgi:hypothetical protein